MECTGVLRFRGSRTRHVCASDSVHNAVASVFASVAVVTVSMALGYRGVLIAGAALYVVAAIANGRFRVRAQSV
jgi:hypothetical protein